MGREYSTQLESTYAVPPLLDSRLRLTVIGARRPEMIIDFPGTLALEAESLHQHGNYKKATKGY
jgi:hypothetical protein